MKQAIFIALAAGMMVTGQTSAQDMAEHTVVAVRPSVNVWAQRLGDELSANLRFPTSFWRNGPPTGFVSVRFECGQDGKPTNLIVLHRPNHRLAVEAVRAVRALTTLHPLPAGVEPGRQMQANVIFADSQDDLEHQARLLQHAEAARMASSPAERSVLAFNMESRDPG